MYVQVQILSWPNILYNLSNISQSTESLDATGCKFHFFKAANHSDVVQTFNVSPVFVLQSCYGCVAQSVEH